MLRLILIHHEKYCHILGLCIHLGGVLLNLIRNGILVLELFFSIRFGLGSTCHLLYCFLLSLEMSCLLSDLSLARFGDFCYHFLLRYGSQEMVGLLLCLG